MLQLLLGGVGVEGHTHSQCHWGQAGTWAKAPWERPGLDLPPACHTPSMPVYAVTRSERVAQGCSPGVVIGPCPILMPAPSALLCSAFLFEAQYRSRTLSRNVCLWPSLLGGLGQMLCLQVLGPGVQRQMTCPGSPQTCHVGGLTGWHELQPNAGREETHAFRVKAVPPGVPSPPSIYQES